MRLIRLLKNDLAKESAQWVEAGLIEQQQAEQICQQYGVDYHRAQSHSYGYSILIGLGFLFIGLALITLIGANWDEIPRAVRMTGLIVLTMSTQLFGWLQWRSGKAAAAVNTFTIGNLFYGASIILIAQIYHLGEHMPDGVYWWALGCLPFALITQSRALMIQTLCLSLIYLLQEASMGFYPWRYLPFIVAMLWYLLRGPSSLLVLLGSVFAIGFWVESSFAWLWSIFDPYSAEFYLSWHVEHVVITAALFLIVWGISRKLANLPSIKAADYAAALSLWSLRFAIISLLILSFESSWEEMVEASWSNLLPALAFYLFACGLACWLSGNAWQIKVTLAFSALGLLLMLPALVGYEYILLLQVLDNLLLIAVGCGLIVHGIQQGTSHYFYLGVTSILLTGLLRYFDLIGDYIGGALLFMVFAAILLGAARFWKLHAAKQAAIEEVGHD